MPENVENSASAIEWKTFSHSNTKEELHDPDNHDRLITHLEPDILEFEVKRA